MNPHQGTDRDSIIHKENHDRTGGPYHNIGLASSCPEIIVFMGLPNKRYIEIRHNHLFKNLSFFDHSVDLFRNVSGEYNLHAYSSLIIELSTVVTSLLFTILVHVFFTQLCVDDSSVHFSTFKPFTNVNLLFMYFILTQYSPIHPSL
jgi:hypothetical protein